MNTTVMGQAADWISKMADSAPIQDYAKGVEIARWLLVAIVEIEAKDALLSTVNDNWLQAQQGLDAAKAELEQYKVDFEEQMRDNAALRAELASIATDRDEWKDEAISAQSRFKQAEELLTSIKAQEPVEFQIKILDNRWTHCAKNLYHPYNPATRALYLAEGAQPFTLPKQEPLGAEFAKVLHDNLDDLYEGESAPEQAQSEKAVGSWYEDLKFVQRVLESYAPDQDRLVALEAVRRARKELHAGAQPVKEPTTLNPDRLEQIIDDYIEDYEMLGEAADGTEAGYTPTEGDKVLLKDAILGLLADTEWDKEWGLHIASLAAPVQAQERKPLTLSEIMKLMERFPDTLTFRSIRAIEAAHGIK